MCNGATREPVKQFICIGASFNEKGDTNHQGGEEESSYSQKSQCRPAQDMEEQRELYQSHWKENL